MKRRIDENIRITTEAVRWLRRLEAEPTQETADRFGEWLRASPLHVHSFLKQSAIEEAIQRVQARDAKNAG